MTTNILLIILGVALIIIPLTGKIFKEKPKQLTARGITFISVVLAIALLQIFKETNNANKDAISKAKIDSLKTILISTNDSFLALKKAFLLLDTSLKKSTNKIVSYRILNDSLSRLVLESDRPQLILNSSKILKKNLGERNFITELLFINAGKRSMNNIHGMKYIIFDDNNKLLKLFSCTMSLSKSIILSNKDMAYVEEAPLFFNPEKEDLNFDTYIYIDLWYSDLTLNKEYNYNNALKISKSKKGHYDENIPDSKGWEFERIKKYVQNLK